jgi:hypothetical protein
MKLTSPFGSAMNTRSYVASTKYRYGFNTQEKDDEVASDNNSYTAEFWQYDGRLGRRFNLDPRPNPSMSTYACLRNNPILFVDIFGDTANWKDGNGNNINAERMKGIKAFILYDPNNFNNQAMSAYNDYVKLYGKENVALAAINTETEFSDNWGAMGGNSIQVVDLYFHGNAQNIMINYTNGEYLTTSGNGSSSNSATPATDISKLPKPKGNISNATLNIHTCHANSSITDKTNKNGVANANLNVVDAFIKYSNFLYVGGTDGSRNFDSKTYRPDNYYWDEYTYKTNMNSSGYKTYFEAYIKAIEDWQKSGGTSIEYQRDNLTIPKPALCLPKINGNREE